VTLLNEDAGLERSSRGVPAASEPAASEPAAAVLVRDRQLLHHPVDREERGHRQLHRTLLPQCPEGNLRSDGPASGRGKPSAPLRLGSHGLAMMAPGGVLPSGGTNSLLLKREGQIAAPQK
jgi:hypothetical protein